MFPVRSLMSRNSVLLSWIKHVSIRHQSNLPKNKQKARVLSRKPVPFKLATNIHASMLTDLKKSEKSNLNVQICKDDHKTITESDSKWKKEYEDLFEKLQKSQPSFSYFKSLENSFRDRIPELSLEKSLQVADMFFLNKYRQWIFLAGLFDYVVQKHPSSFQSNQITHLMFYVFFLGQAPPGLYKQIEEHLTKNLHEFHINNIGIICLGFFRGHNRVRSFELLYKISERVLEDFQELQENMLINILKSFRHSGFAEVKFFETLSEKMLSSSFIKKSTSLNNLMHIAMTYACSSICCKELNQELITNFVKLVQNQKGRSMPRSKDIGKFVWAMGNFVHEPVKEKSSYLKLVEAFSSVNWRQEKQHPESLSDMLQGLTYLDIHPHHLIERIFQPQAATALRDNAIYGKLFQLQLFQNTTLIECPDYKGRLLSEKFMRDLQQLPGMTGDLNFEMKTRQGLLQIHSSLQSMLGSCRVHVHFILPHFTLADIELRLDSCRHPVEFEASSFNSVVKTRDPTQSDTGSPKTDNQTYKVALEILGYNQCFLNTFEMKGNIQTKLRQLETLGYLVVVFKPDEASKLSDMKEANRQEYLVKKLHSEVGLNIPLTSST